MKHHQYTSHRAGGNSFVVVELIGHDRAIAPDLGITVRAYAPVFTLARALQAAGVHPDLLLDVHRGSTPCFTVTVAVAIRLTVRDTRHGTPYFSRWKASPGARAASPIAWEGKPDHPAREAAE